ncbi:hypothetical protein LCGC14_1259690 [marine sediment metagenome]|uniref:CSD domain-containing protein n=1 Tax=marine sediment metagenome TaxID=412755 RepID=A0A0F9LMG2_9ZZZZ
MNALRIALIVLALAIFGCAGVVSAEEGTVKWFIKDKGFGFVTLDNGTDVFVHYSVVDGHFDVLHERERVSLTVVQGQRGPKAESVTRTSSWWYQWRQQKDKKRAESSLTIAEAFQWDRTLDLMREAAEANRSK